MSTSRQPSCRLPFSLHRRPPQRRAVSAAVACAMVCLLPAVCTPVLAQTVTVERQTIDQLRATTMALIDALDRQTQQSREQQEQMARQAIDQQRITTLALIEVLASQGLLSREKAETLARLSTPQGLVTAPQAGYAPQAYAAPVAAAAPFAPASAQQPAYAPPVQRQQPFAAAQAAPAPRQPAQQGQPPAGSPLAAAAASLPLAAAAIAAQGAAAAAAASPYAAPPVVQGPVPTSAQALAAAQAAQRQPAWGDPPLPAGTPPAGNTVRVPYISESLKAQLRADIRNDVLAVAREERWADPRLLPDWVRSLSLHGDLRVRGQYEHLPKTNLPAFDYRSQTSSPAWSPDLVNTQLDRTRMTLRARLAVDAKAGDNFEAGLRLSTGTTSGPTSSSQTLGTGFNKSTLVLDRAFIKWEPIQDLRLLAGRFGNPFFSSDLIWPDDIGFDGVAVQAERTITSGVYAFATVGAFPLEEFNVDSRDKWLYGAQIGIDWALSNRTQWRTGLALYDFHNVQGVRETAQPPSFPRMGTVPYFNSQYPASIRLKGNTLINLNDSSPAGNAATPTWGLASKFRPINFSTVLTLKHFEPLDIAFGLDFVKNSAFDAKDIAQRAGVAPGDDLRNRSTGLQARLAVGKARLGEKGDWQLTTALRHFERDAWLDGFTDTTWNLGGTSYRGWSIAGQYALDRRTSLGLRVTSTRNLDDGYRAPVTGEATKSSAPLRIDVMQVDLNARF